MSVAIEDVEWCYRNLLGRAPESTEVSRRHVANSANLHELILRFIDCKEFKQRRGFMPTFIPLNNPPMDVQTSATPAELSALTERIRRAWTHMGLAYPHHSVLTAKEYLPGNLTDAALKRFWASGDREVAITLSILNRHGFKDAGSKIACEYGSGLGRFTLPLAKVFRQVHAYDISETHLEAAKLEAHNRTISNVTFHLCVDDLQSNLEQCDFFYSRIVFQHNPPPLMRLLVKNCLLSLRPMGIAVFQVPTYRPNYTFNVDQYLSRPAGNSMEMHCIPQHEIFAIIKELGLDLLEVREDGSTGRPGEWLSNTLVVRNPGKQNYVVGFGK